MRPVAIVGVLLLLPVAAQPARAQTASPLSLESAAFPPHALASAAPGGFGPEVAAATALPLPQYGGWVGVTKWVTLGASVGFGIMGAVLHRQANEDFQRLELLCQANPEPCRDFNEDGSYADLRLEKMFQDVTHKDDLARLSLIAAELAFGTSVVLFIVDFQNKPGPSDIPYDPDEEQSKLQLAVAPGQITLRYYIQ